MGQAVGQTLPFAVGIALSPIPIVGVVLMLATPRARGNGVAFLGGWILGLAVAGTLVLLISGGAGAAEEGGPADWVNVLKLALGIVLLAVAVKTWRGRPRPGEEAPMPSWMRSVDHFGPSRSFALAVALSALNPKNLVLVLGAAAAIAEVGLDAGDDAIAMAIFVVIATLGPAAPVAIYLVLGERSRRLLDELRAWMADNNATIMAVICLLIGAKLVGDGIGGF
jgi:threonine/homoserine/homoserine lactone efflux protein